MCNMGNEMFDKLNADSIKIKCKFVWNATKSEEYKRVLASDNTIESPNAVISELE